VYAVASVDGAFVTEHTTGPNAIESVRESL